MEPNHVSNLKRAFKKYDLNGKLWKQQTILFYFHKSSQESQLDDYFADMQEIILRTLYFILFNGIREP